MGRFERDGGLGRELFDALDVGGHGFCSLSTAAHSAQPDSWLSWQNGSRLLAAAQLCVVIKCPSAVIDALHTILGRRVGQR